MWRVYLLSALIAAASGGITAYVTVKLAAPEVPAGNRMPPAPLTQRLDGLDHLEFPTGDAPSEKIIYYTRPFVSPPKLRLIYGGVDSHKFTGGDSSYKITDQTEKWFKLQRDPCPVKGKEEEWRKFGCEWEAEGLAAK